jgi:hypothetical protein
LGQSQLHTGLSPWGKVSWLEETEGAEDFKKKLATYMLLTTNGQIYRLLSI